MGDRPCEIIPVPKRMDLEPGRGPWPRRVEVHCESAQGAPLVATYRTELRGAVDENGGGRCDQSEALLTIRLVDEPCRPEGYALHFREQTLIVSAGYTAGFRHALQTIMQIASTRTVPTGTLHDWPALGVRGFHLNFESYRRLDCQQAVRLIRTAAHFKLNTLLVEYGPRFPFDAHREIRDSLCLSVEDIEQLNGEAADHGIRLIPLQQSIAHLEYALRHERLAHLRERPDKANLMCPSHPESLALFKTLAADLIQRHPRAEWFHLGGDEARKVGHCPRCSSSGTAPAELYGGYIGEAARWLLDRGLRPMVWDDTLCAYPQGFEYLPKETIIDYWDYIAVADPTPVLIPRMSHACGGPRVAHDWRWNVAPKRGRISDVQAQVMKDYSHAVRMKSALGARYMMEFGRYLAPVENRGHMGFPRWIRALPYLEYYQDRGHEVITSPTGMGNGDSSGGGPNFDRFEHNIRIHARRCKDNAKALGIITTTWYNIPPEMLYHPLIRTAQCAW